MASFVLEETIVAPATPPGEGGVAVVRLSGPLAEPLLRRFFVPTHKPSRPFESHRLYHGRIETGDGELIDEVLAVVMRRPHSFTREDVVEIQCHGSNLVVRRLLEIFIDAGARLARPGEFTLRAFLNGRLDLSQAEAVIDVIRSSSEAACRVALRQLEGSLSRAVHGFRDDITDLLALVEAYIDFPEEDLGILQQPALESKGLDVLAGIDRLLHGFESGRTLREGMAVLILGRPNVGKSSLLNALLREARAIVTEIPGTTRDTIEESLTLGGIPLRLIDTAGIRPTEDPVEREGVERAKGKAGSADLVLLVMDGSIPPQEEDHLAYAACTTGKVLLVLNKSDLPCVPLPSPFSALPSVRVSARTGIGLDLLEKIIAETVVGDGGPERFESILVSDRRHWEALVRAREGLQRFISGTRDAHPLELLALELRQALQALGEITGETTPDDVLERIFSRFCIGK